MVGNLNGAECVAEAGFERVGVAGANGADGPETRGAAVALERPGASARIFAGPGELDEPGHARADGDINVAFAGALDTRAVVFGVGDRRCGEELPKLQSGSGWCHGEPSISR